MPEYSDRPAARRKMRDVLVAAFAAATAEGDDDVNLSTVTVRYAGGGDDTKGRWSVVLGQIDNGEETPSGVAKSRTPRKDTYRIPVVVEVREAGTAEDGDRITQLILNVINRAMFEGDRLAPLRVATYPGRLDGPNPYQTEGTGAYLLSQAVRFVDLECNVTG